MFVFALESVVVKKHLGNFHALRHGDDFGGGADVFKKAVTILQIVQRQNGLKKSIRFFRCEFGTVLHIVIPCLFVDWVDDSRFYH